MNKIKLIFRDIVFYKAQTILFVLCILFSIGTFISIDSLGSNIENYVNTDSKALAGGDLVFESNTKYSKNISNYFNKIKNNPKIIIANSYEFTTIVYTKKNQNSILTQTRIIDNTYPLYGEVILKNNLNFKENFQKDNVFVEEELLNLMNLSINDYLTIGNKSFQIKAIIISEPDSPINLFKLGPKILINSKNLEELNLVGDKSRVEYETLLKIENEELTNQVYEKINEIKSEEEEIEFYNQTNSTLERFTINFLFFIKLISIFIIFITGIGITSTLTSLLIDMKESIGIKKILGEKSKNIIKYYLSFIITLSLIGFIFAIIFSNILIKYLPIIFEQILPQDITVYISTTSMIQGLIITLILSILFTLIPLIKTKNIKPISLFKKEEEKINKKTQFIIYSLIVLFFSTLIFIEIKEIKTSIYILLGSIITFLIIYSISNLFVFTLKKLRNKSKNLTLKLAINGLSRIGNKTTLILFSISLSLTLIFTLTFIETNLQENFITSFPENAPNLFLIDIPKSEIENIKNLFEEQINIYPIIRGPILDVNNEDIENISKRLSRGEPVTRDFSLTYSNKLLDSEKLIKSNTLFEENWNKGINQVSVLEDIANRMELKIGDNITFLVQGIEIKAQVVSIRKRLDESSIGAFFYFTFEPEVLENAPQTLFSTIKVNSSKIPAIQRQIAENYPQITVINGENTAKTIGEIIKSLSNIVSFFTIFSLIGGILILLSSIYATNLQRIKESVYYKLVGAKKKFITKIFVMEYLILAISSAIISLILSLSLAFVVSEFLLEVEFKFLIINIIFYIILTIIVILSIGFFSIYKAVRKKPIEYIRENNIE